MVFNFHFLFIWFYLQIFAGVLHFCHPFSFILIQNSISPKVRKVEDEGLKEFWVEAEAEISLLILWYHSFHLSFFRGFSSHFDTTLCTNTFSFCFHMISFYLILHLTFCIELFTRGLCNCLSKHLIKH